MKKRVSYFIKSSALAVMLAAILLVVCGCCVFHSYDKVVTPPTCTEKGFTTSTCSKCGKEKISGYTEPLGHNYESSQLDPTCTEVGGTLFTCSRCGDKYLENETAALGHDYVISTVAPTCTEDGLTLHTCSRCGDSYSEKLFDPIGHNFRDKITVPATCKAAGTIAHICDRCGYTTTESYSLEVLTSEQVYDRAKKSVGEIRIFDNSNVALGLGTCFAIDEGVFVTNYHVIENAYTAKIYIANDILYVNTVLAFDKNLDIAIVKAAGSGKDIPYLPVCREFANGGATVYAVGSSEGLTLSFSTGVVASPDRVMDGVHFVQHNAAISQGNSGGPLFNVYGEVIGINSLSYKNGQNLNFAISAREIDRLDRSHPVLMKDFATTYGPYFTIEPKEKIVEEEEGNDYIENAQPLDENGITVHGKLSKSSDCDIYKITLMPGETINIIVQSKSAEETRGIFCVLLDEDETSIDQTYTSTYNGGTVSAMSFKNRSTSNMTLYIGVTYRSAYTNKSKVLEYWMFSYKKGGTVEKYDYVDSEFSVKFKAPDKWIIETDPYFSAEEYMSDNNVSIMVSQLSGLTVDEYMDLINSTAKSMFSQSGVSVAISKPKTVTLGGSEFQMETITVSAGGQSIKQYVYYKASGDSIILIQINIYDGSPLSTFEAMFE